MEESSNNSRTSVDNRKAFSALPQTVDRLNGKMVSSVRTIRIVHANGALRDIESLLFIFLTITVLPPSSSSFFFLSFFFSKIILGELEKLYPLPRLFIRSERGC